MNEVTERNDDEETMMLRRRIERLSNSMPPDVGPLQDLLHLMLNRIVALEAKKS